MKKAAFLMLLLLAACNRSDGTETLAAETAVPPVAEPVEANTNESDTAVSSPTETITLRMVTYDWDSASYRDLIETFEAENPDIEIQIVSIEETLGLGSDGMGQWPEDAARRLVSAADVVPTNAIGITNGASGLLLDLRPLIEADSTFDRADFYPNALEYFESDGGIWGLPTALNFNVIFYNKDAFDAAGHDYPQAGWSWEDLLTAAKATTVRDGSEVTQWGLVQLNQSPYELVVSRIGPLVDTSTNPPIAQFDRPEVAEALQWFVDLYLLHEVAPNLETPEPDEDGTYIPPGYELIDNGQTAMWPEYSGSWQWRSSQMNLGVVPFPVDTPNDHSTTVYVDGYVLSAGTRHPEAAWRWIKFLSQQPSVSGFSLDTAVPARRSVAEAGGFWDRVNPELGTALRFALDHAYIYQFAPGYGAFSEAAQSVLQNEKTVDEALAEAQTQAENEIATFIAGQEGAEAVEIVVSEPEESAVPEEAVTILFTTGGGTGGLQPYRDLADAFREVHPDIVVELQTPDFGTGVVNLSTIANATDCLQWFGGVSREEDRSAILNIEPFLDADPSLSKDDFYPSIVEAFSYQGQLWALPAETNLAVVVYNKALFDAASLPYPTLDWTTDDFLETAVALTTGSDPETKQYGYVPQELEINDLSNFLERLGAQFLDESVDPPQLTFTHPDTIDAMRWFTGLTTEFAVKPTFNTQVFGGSVNFGEERKALIENGRAAMWTDQGFGSFPEISLEGLDIGMVPLPDGPDGTATADNLVIGYFISAQTTQRQACWEWIKFLSEQPYIGNFGNTIPARRSVAESTAYAQAVGAEQAAVNLDTVSSLTGSSATRRIGSEANWLELGFSWWQIYAYDQIIANGRTVEDVLTEVQAKSDAYRTCVIDRDGLADQATQRVCLGETDEDAPPIFLEVN